MCLTSRPHVPSDMTQFVARGFLTVSHKCPGDNSSHPMLSPLEVEDEEDSLEDVHLDAQAKSPLRISTQLSVSCSLHSIDAEGARTTVEKTLARRYVELYVADHANVKNEAAIDSVSVRPTNSVALISAFHRDCWFRFVCWMCNVRCPGPAKRIRHVRTRVRTRT